jgi:hypothetical protein
MALKLPVAPFREEIPFTRYNKQYIAVKGLNDQGYLYLWIEEVELEDDLTVRWVPKNNPQDFVHGVCKPAEVYWEKEYYLNGKYVKTAEGSRTVITINHPDMIEFSASLGLMKVGPMFNGFVRAILGHDDQPLFAGDGTKIDETTIDTTLAPDNTYYTHQAEEDTTTDPIV